jgi:hypothetical protein
MQQQAVRRNGADAGRAIVRQESDAEPCSRGAVLSSRLESPHAVPDTPGVSGLQPMPTCTPSKALDMLGSAAPGAGSRQSTAMLQAMHDYMASALPDTFRADPLTTFSTDASALNRMNMVMPLPTLSMQPPAGSGLLVGNSTVPPMVTRATAAAMLKTSQRMATAFQKLQPALEGQLGRNGGRVATGAAQTPEDRDSFATWCLAHYLTQIQDLLAEGLPEADAAFVSKLAAELLASQPGEGLVTAGSYASQAMCKADAALVHTSSHPVPAVNGIVQESGNAVHAAVSGPSSTQEDGVAQDGGKKRAPCVTPQVATFLDRPYRLLQDLHTRVDHSAVWVALDDQEQEITAAGVAKSRNGSGATLGLQGEQKVSSASDAHDNCINDSSGRAKNAAGIDGAPPAKSALFGWQAVLRALVSAGPQPVQPLSPRQPGSSGGWASTRSSTEPDSVSFRSEDVFVGDGGTAGTVAATVHTAVATETNIKKGKKRRGKKGKASQR